MTDFVPHPPGQTQRQANALVMEYIHVRQALGYLGFFLPLSLLGYGLLSGHGMQSSISAFYYTHMGDVLVGTLCAIGIFLFAYKGYARRRGEVLSDKWLARSAGLGAMGVALFPVHPAAHQPQLAQISTINLGIEHHPDLLHFASAAVFFACMALFCICVFTKGSRDEHGAPLWDADRVIYTSCGGLIIAAMLAMLPYSLSDNIKATLAPYNYIFFCETIGVFAFATAWLCKGKGLRLLQRAAGRIAPDGMGRP